MIYLPATFAPGTVVAGKIHVRYDKYYMNKGDIFTSNICAGYTSGGKDTCQVGDKSQQAHDVIMTSDRRRCDVMTSHRR